MDVKLSIRVPVFAFYDMYTMGRNLYTRLRKQHMGGCADGDGIHELGLFYTMSVSGANSTGCGSRLSSECLDSVCSVMRMRLRVCMHVDPSADVLCKQSLMAPGV